MEMGVKQFYTTGVSEIAEEESLGNCGLDDRGSIWFRD